MRLTDVEKQRGVQPEWIPLQDAIELFSKHESYADISEEICILVYPHLCRLMDIVYFEKN